MILTESKDLRQFEITIAKREGEIRDKTLKHKYNERMIII